MLPEAASRHYHYVLRIKVVTEGAIIKVDFVEGLGGESDDLTLVEAPVLVLANDLLAGSDAQQGSLGTLEETAWVILERTDNSDMLLLMVAGEISEEKDQATWKLEQAFLSRYIAARGTAHRSSKPTAP